jgi:adenine-specific DNA-methyltransferase
MAKKPIASKSVETLTHDEATRKNIPTAEYQSVVAKEVESPIRVAFERGATGLDEEKQRRTRDLDPQLVWRGKDEQDWSDLVVQAPPLYIQEKVLHPKVLIDDLLRRSQADRKEAEPQLDLFADFNGLPSESSRTEFYQHDANWSNRMILGDSLQVMASLAEREGLRGKVQCIYIDPPYGIKFNSNFQWSTTSHDVKDGKVDHITREPEQVKAFRDTWRDGIHSYLTYLRDRLTVARDLLTDSGSIFVQIGDENVHRVRALMDEVFGSESFISQITFRKKLMPLGAKTLESMADFIVWYEKNKTAAKYHQLYVKTIPDPSARWTGLELINGTRRLMTSDERRDLAFVPPGAKVFATVPQIAPSFSEKSVYPFEFEGIVYNPPKGSCWVTTLEKMKILTSTNRMLVEAGSPRYVMYHDDFPYTKITNPWTDTPPSQGNVYVVQTNELVIARCLLMATDPGDLVIDPTSGSGTTVYVSEQWGRRWITIDTSRVALALARARIMGARYPYYLLADSPEGQLKEAEITGTAPSSQPTRGDIRQGFVYERVPHITLKSIANNAKIYVIWEKFQVKLEPLREKLNSALGRVSPSPQPSLARGEGEKRPWEEWEIPREADDKWSEEAKKLHAQWWQQRIARQKEIDASIAAKAEFEFLYDKPYEDKKTVRVAGPFTVESLSPHRVLGVDENDDLIDGLADPKDGYGEERDFTRMILENLKTAGVQQAHKEDKIVFTSLTPWPGELICAEGRFEGSGE